MTQYGTVCMYVCICITNVFVMDGWVHPGMINNLSSKGIKKYHSTGQTKKIVCTKWLIQEERVWSTEEPALLTLGWEPSNGWEPKKKGGSIS